MLRLPRRADGLVHLRQRRVGNHPGATLTGSRPRTLRLPLAWRASVLKSCPARPRQGLGTVSQAHPPDIQLKAAPAFTRASADSECYTEDGIGHELAKLVKALHAAGRLDGDQYNLHGLRHTFGVDLALARCTDAQGAAMMGHAGASTFQVYRRQAAG